MLLWALIVLVSILLGMGAVAFITLLERKVLGLSQIRLGPNKLTFLGLLQPVADGVKLLSKQLYIGMFSQSIMFVVSPLLLLIIFMSVWGFVVFWEGAIISQKFSSLLYFSLLGMGAYAVILAGWAVMSTFSKLGGLRGILQSLSYEVSLVLLFFVVLVLYEGFTIKGELFINFELLSFWIVLWILLSLMESNRAPFDLLEGESELISGFNIEMGSLMFVYLFLSEYGMIIVMSLVLSLVVLESVTMLAFLMSGLILLVRSCYPRVRYDTLMSLMWQSILPVSLLAFMVQLFTKF